MKAFVPACILFALSLFPFFISAQSPAKEGVYIPKVLEVEGNSLNYNIMYPHDFDVQKKYPLMLFLHGAGERGSDNKAQLVHGGKLFQDSLRSFPAVVIFPQCPKEDYWVNMDSKGKGSARNIKIITDQGPNPTMTMVIELISQTLKEDYIEKERFYVAGLSMGGMGTIELGWRMPGKIAAAIAICGAGPREKAALMQAVPFWFIHGTKDNVVPSRYSRIMLESMQKTGGKAKITLYPNTNHNSWDRAFANPEFLPFLFTKSK